jgi:hypothetical protein
VVVLAGCAPSSGFQEGEYVCHDTPVSLDALLAGRPASDLGPGGLAAMRGRLVPSIDLDKWVIVEESEERVVLVREVADPHLPERDRPYRPLYTHDLISVVKHQVDGSGPLVWHLRSDTSCSLQRALDGLSETHVALHPDHPPPEPGSTQIHLWAIENRCAGHVPSADRVRLVQLVETETTVEVIVGMESSEGGVCAGNIPAPLVIELAEPLGDRELIDDSVYPPQLLTAAAVP